MSGDQREAPSTVEYALIGIGMLVIALQMVITVCGICTKNKRLAVQTRLAFRNTTPVPTPRTVPTIALTPASPIHAIEADSPDTRGSTDEFFDANDRRDAITGGGIHSVDLARSPY